MTSYLGYDCANKSLAWSHVTIDTDILIKLAALLPDLKRCVDENLSVEQCLGVIGRFRSVMSGFFRYHSAGVTDLLDGVLMRDTDEIDRTIALHRFLKDQAIPTDTEIVIEHQNNIGAMTNRASTIVSAQLAYHYVSHNHEVTYVDPGLKNKLELAPHLSIRDYVARELPRHKKVSDARYAANKKHSRDSFTYVLDLFGHSYVYRDTPKIYLDDLADSTMELLAIVRRDRLLAQALFLSDYSYVII